MTFTTDFAELLKGLTDLPLAVAAAVCAVLLMRRTYDRRWPTMYGLIAVTALVGGFVHAFKLSYRWRQLLWIGLYFALYIILYLFTRVIDAHLFRRMDRVSIRLTLLCVVCCFVSLALLLNADKLPKDSVKNADMIPLVVYAVAMIVRLLASALPRHPSRRLYETVALLALAAALQIVAAFWPWVVAIQHLLLIGALITAVGIAPLRGSEEYRYDYRQDDYGRDE